MKCDEVRSELFAYGCGDIAGEERRQLEAHLADCPHCREQFEAARVLQEAVRSHMRAAIESPDVTESVMSMLPERRRTSTGRKRVFAWAAGVCLAAALVIGLFLHKPEQRTAKRVVASPPTRATAPHKPTIDAPRPAPPDKQMVVRRQMKAQPRMAYKYIRGNVRTGTVAQVTRTTAVEHEQSSIMRPIRITRTELPVQSDRESERSRITTTLVIAGVTVTDTRETIVTPVEPDGDVEPIERPPLEMVVEPDRHDVPGGV